MTGSRQEKYRAYADLALALEGLLAGESDWIANTANAASAIFHGLPALNWAGFYFLRGDDLVLGPFQGKPACVRIALGKGVWHRRGAGAQHPGGGRARLPRPHRL